MLLKPSLSIRYVAGSGVAVALTCTLSSAGERALKGTSRLVNESVELPPAATNCRVLVSQPAVVQTGIRVGDDGQMPRFVPREELFKGRHFDQEIVILCVRWYLNFKLSFRDLVAMMCERGINLAHGTVKLSDCA